MKGKDRKDYTSHIAAYGCDMSMHAAAQLACHVFKVSLRISPDRLRRTKCVHAAAHLPLQMSKLNIRWKSSPPTNKHCAVRQSSTFRRSKLCCGVIQRTNLERKHGSYKMDKSLTPQAFASNNLDRSTTDRRNKDFLSIVFPQSLFLVVSQGKVVVWRKSKTELRWFRPVEMQNLAYSAASDVLSRSAGITLHVSRSVVAISAVELHTSSESITGDLGALQTKRSSHHTCWDRIMMAKNGSLFSVLADISSRNSRQAETWNSLICGR